MFFSTILYPLLMIIGLRLLVRVAEDIYAVEAGLNDIQLRVNSGGFFYRLAAVDEFLREESARDK